MNHRKAIAIALIQLNAGAKIYGVKFLDQGFVKADGKTYYYKDTSNLDIFMFDTVVVEARDSIGLAQVVEVDVSPARFSDLGCIRHIVCKIDLTAHRFKLDAENKAGQVFAMSEINERMARLRDQIGAEQFNSAAAMLGVKNAATEPQREDDEVIETK